MEKVSDRQLGSIIVLTIISGILMSGGSDRSMQNAWIAAALAVAVMVPVYLIYMRITWLFPGKGLFEVAYRVYGKIGGGIIVALMSIYAFYVGGMAMRTFSEFNQVVSMPETSQIVTLIIIGIVCIYTVKKGIGTLGGFANLVTPLIIFLILLMNVLSLPDWKIYYTLPLMHNPGKEFFSDIFTAAVYPIGEAVLVCTLFGFKKEKKGYGKIFLWSLVSGGILLVLETLRAIMVLGANTISILYYPSYTATGVINIMDFFTRIEVTISASFMVAQIVKICVCVYAFSSGIGSLVGASSYKALVTPTVFAMVSLALIVFKNTIDSYEFLDTYRVYAVFFQLVIPVALWIGAEVVSRQEKRLAAPT